MLLAPCNEEKRTRGKCANVWLLIASYLLLVFALPLTLSAVVSYRALPAGRTCAQCGGETLQLLVPGLRRLGVVVGRLAIQRRSCPGCGWDGMVRCEPLPVDAVSPTDPVAGARRAGEGGEPPEGPPTRSDFTDRRGRPEPPHGSTQTLDVRSLTLNGTAWHVMLQCWHGTERCYGRFVFVAPSGRLWMDSTEALSGTTEDDVLGQAQALSDVLLTRRLRRLVTDY